MIAIAISSTLGILGVIYLFIGVILAVRVQTLYENGKVKVGYETAPEWFLGVVVWGLLGIASIWEKGIDDL